MRLITKIKQSDFETKRLMIYESREGVFLFGFNSLKDSPSNWDEWYATIEDAKEASNAKFGIELMDWVQINEPMEGCQDDWINPVRVKGRSIGTPDWNTFEKLENGEWINL